MKRSEAIEAAARGLSLCSDHACASCESWCDACRTQATAQEALDRALALPDEEGTQATELELRTTLKNALDQHDRTLGYLARAAGAETTRAADIIRKVEALRRGREQSELLKGLPLPDHVMAQLSEFDALLDAVRGYTMSPTPERFRALFDFVAKATR